MGTRMRDETIYCDVCGSEKDERSVEFFEAQFFDRNGDGTLRTRHLSTNVRIEIDEAGDTATAKSYYVVFQATDALPFQAIVGGRYEDRFERANGSWRFADRLVIVDQIGNMAEHLTFDLAQGGVRFHDQVQER